MRQAHQADSGTFFSSYGWLLLLAVSLSAFNCLYVINDVAYSLPAGLLNIYLLPLSIMIWVVWDARSRNCTPCHDFGFFVYLWWIFAIPGYLIWTRGLRGLLVLIGFVLLIMMPWVAHGIAWEFLR